MRPAAPRQAFGVPGGVVVSRLPAVVVEFDIDRDLADSDPGDALGGELEAVEQRLGPTLALVAVRASHAAADVEL